MMKNIDVEENLFYQVRAIAKAEATTVNAILKRALQCYLEETSKNSLAPIEEYLGDLLLVQDADTSDIVSEKIILGLLTKTQAYD